VQELKVFLEAEGSLEKHFGWQQLQPVRGSLLEGIGRLPRQLIGAGPAVPSTVEAQQNARNTSDLLRRFRELGERMRQEYKAPPVLDDQEVQLRVRRGAGRDGASLRQACVAALSRACLAQPFFPTYRVLVVAGATCGRGGVCGEAGGGVAARGAHGQGV
jgi:hypothetical protein